MISPVSSLGVGLSGRQLASGPLAKVNGLANGLSNKPDQPPGQAKKQVQPPQADNRPQLTNNSETSPSGIQSGSGAARDATQQSAANQPGDGGTDSLRHGAANAVGVKSANENSRHGAPDRPDSVSFGTFRLQEQVSATNEDDMRRLASAAYAQAAIDRLISNVGSTAKGWISDTGPVPAQDPTPKGEPTIDVRSPADAVAEIV